MTKLNFQENISLSLYTTFKIGGPAKFFCEVKNVDELTKAISFANLRDIDYFVLSGGSNLIVSDNGFDGLVIRLNFTHTEWENNSLTVGSGAIINDLVTQSTQKGLAGIEWAGGLPGTLGGAIRGNAGAFSGEIKDVILNVTSYKSGEGILVRGSKDCRFGYRTSVYKHSPEIIIEAELEFKQSDSKELVEIANSRREYRDSHHPMEYPSSGSVFKNISVSYVSQKVLEIFGGVIKNDPFPVIPTAAVLAKLELSGYTFGGAQISRKHPNYIVNIGGAKSEDIINVIQYVIARVATEYDIRLEVEPQLVGFDKKYSWESQ